MGGTIYYFSGRGNSLSVARELAQRLGNVEIRPIRPGMEPIRISGDVAGFAMPVIDFGIPSLVRNFIKRLYCSGKVPYLFGVITYGGMPGASMTTLQKLLQKQGLCLDAGFSIQFGMKQMTEGEWTVKLSEMADLIRNKGCVPIPSAGFMGFLTTGLGNSLARAIIPMEDKKFRLADNCNGCGICQKLCPVDNIKIEKGKPVWLHHCEQCAACFSWCPKEAISGSCLAAKTHYQNPRVTLAQLVGEKRAEA